MGQHGFRGRIGQRMGSWQGRAALCAALVCASPLAACDDESGAGDASDVSDTQASDASDTQASDASDTQTNDASDTNTSDVSDDTQASDANDVAPAPFELEGVWKSEFGEEIITRDTWTGFCVDAIRRADEVANVAILETLSGDGCLVGTFSRVTWKDIADDAFDYCTTAFGEATADDAASAPTDGFDANDLAKGCGGFPWSHLTRAP